MTSLASALLESERAYFELAATSLTMEGATVVWIPGLESVPGSSVVQGVRPHEIRTDPGRWVEQVIRQVRELGCSMVRVYLLTFPSRLDDALAAAGLRSRTEIGYLAYGQMLAGRHRSDVSLRRIAGDAAWETKRKLHAQSTVASDGHASVSEDWVELERRKSDTGKMQAFFIEVDGEVCGSVATLESETLIRAKNVFVHPERRREGIAAQAIRLLAQRAEELGKEAIGIFGVEGNPGNAVYQHLGMTPAVRQFEWSRVLVRATEEP